MPGRSAPSSATNSAPHQFCQIHYLRNLAEPLAARDSALTVTLPQTVRGELGPLLHADQPPDPLQPGVLTMTGFVEVPASAPDDGRTPAVTRLPSAALLATPSVSDAADPTSGSPDHDIHTRAADVVTHLLRRTRYLLTLTGRPPLRGAGVELYAGLLEVVTRGRRLLAHRHDPQLAELVAGLAKAVDVLASTVGEIQVGADWLARISAILADGAEPARSAAQVAEQMQACLNQLDHEQLSTDLATVRQHLHKVSRSYWPGLFHCYDHPDIPRTNTGIESLFRDTQRRVLRTTGQKGRTRHILHRHGAWELLAHPPTEAASRDALRQIAPTDLADERQRMRQHAERFRLHTRSPPQTTAQLDRLEQQWLALPPTGTA